jgi:hypothetical protein
VCLGLDAETTITAFERPAVFNVGLLPPLLAFARKQRGAQLPNSDAEKVKIVVIVRDFKWLIMPPFTKTCSLTEPDLPSGG